MKGKRGELLPLGYKFKCFEVIDYIIIRHGTDNRKGYVCKCINCGDITKRIKGNILRTVGDCKCVHPVGKYGHRLKEIKPEYKCWLNIKLRCRNPKIKQYDKYGGRGIDICEEWFNSFKSFFDHIGKRPSRKHSVDRINNDGNYEPGNVRWATVKEQANNRSSNVEIEYDGHTLNITQWAELLNVRPQLINSRLKRGYSIADALCHPARKRSISKKNQNKIRNIKK